MNQEDSAPNLNTRHAHGKDSLPNLKKRILAILQASLGYNCTLFVDRLHHVTVKIRRIILLWIWFPSKIGLAS
jgi:hypothetical protein